MFSIYLSPLAEKDYKVLKNKNPTVHSRVHKKLNSLKTDPHSGKMIIGDYTDVRSLRVGSYRILYEIIQKKIYGYSIKHRKDAYR